MTTANLTLADNDTVIQYTAVGGETEFEFDFPILDNAELAVSVDQLDQVLGTDYTVTGVGAAGGGTVTFTSARSAGEVITLWLDMDIKRLTGFATGAAVLAGSALNTEFARQVRHDQMLRRDIGRALRLAIDDPQSGQDMIIPTETVRAGQFLAFAADGTPTVSEGSGGGDTSLRSDLASADASKGFNLIAVTPDAAETAAGAVIVHGQYPNFPEIDIRRYGPDVDFETALATGIEVACRSRLPLRIDHAYEETATVTIAALPGPLKIQGYGSITWTGVAANYMLLISDAGGFDIEIEGLTFDAASLVSRCLRVNNDQGSMAEGSIGNAILRDVKLLNPFLSTTTTQAASGVLFDGGFDTVLLENVLVRNVNRDTGSGIPGSRGCSGISVGWIDTDAFCKRLIIRGGEIDTVTNQEASGTGDDVDCDGVAYFGPGADDLLGVHSEQVCDIDGMTFRNCKGRFVKTQINGFSRVTNWKAVRDLEQALDNARDFGFQHGPGLVADGVYYAFPTSGGGTVWGVSHAVLAPDFAQTAIADNNKDGSFTARNITLYSGIPIATDELPFFCLAITADATRELQNIVLDNIAFVGGRVTRVVESASIGNTARTMITVNGVEGRIASHLVGFTATVDNDVILKLTNNIALPGSETPVLVSLADNGEPLVTGHSNLGNWTQNLNPASSANTIGEILRIALVTGQQDNNENWGAMVPGRTVTLVDDASHAFVAAGLFGLGILTSNFNATVQAVFAYDTSDVIELFQGGATSANVSVGTANTNPDVDGDLNIWVSANGVISIRNRLGSSRRFTLTLFTQG